MAGNERDSGAGGGAVDALLAALTGEPLTPELRDDPAFMAEHRAAEADVALLREQLTAIGDELARPPRTAKAVREKRRREPRPAAAPAGRRRPLRLALGVLAAAGAATVVGTMGWLVTAGPGGVAGGVSDESAAKAAGGDTAAGGPAMHIACSRILVEGTVVSLTPRADGDVRVVLEVKRYYRPERSAADHPTFAVTLDGLAREDLKPGVRTLVRVPVHARDRQDWEVGPGVADARADILEALPDAEGLTCTEPGRPKD
ncbi:hypothetical protein ACFY93_08905 [Streptomyces sp. NPDC008313]|uniref:hypothetical protein n=1 Tax=Streptomyces sp. NPDC008313 TaxID=3364826 RepID=UPI0036E9BD67